MHTVDRFGYSPLRDAVNRGHTEAARVLIAAGASLHVPLLELGVTLCTLAANGDTKVRERVRTASIVTFFGGTHSYQRTPSHKAAWLTRTLETATMWHGSMHPCILRTPERMRIVTVSTKLSITHIRPPTRL